MKLPRIEPILPAAIVTVVVWAGSAALANPAVEQSCRILAVLGGNQLEQVGPMLEDLAARWPEQSRMAAMEQLSGMLRQIAFAGGNVYEIGRLGEGLVEHLVVLRRAAGETAGMRLSYEWTPEGLALTRMDFKLDYSSEPGLTIPVRADAETCP